jgi:hypothetical protein
MRIPGSKPAVCWRLRHALVGVGIGQHFISGVLPRETVVLLPSITMMKIAFWKCMALSYTSTINIVNERKRERRTVAAFYTRYVSRQIECCSSPLLLSNNISASLPCPPMFDMDWKVKSCAVCPVFESFALQLEIAIS